ncbi:MAG: ATP-binding protein [Acutalibacteraceae bacterium]
MKTTVEAKIQNLPELIKLCQQLIGDRAAKSKGFQQLLVAVEEIFVNISSYAYGISSGTAAFEIEYIGNNRVRAEFTDCGIPFNPLEFDSRQRAQDNVLLLIPGGHGIELVKRITENISYKYEGGENILSFEKTLEDAQ